MGKKRKRAREANTVATSKRQKRTIDAKHKSTPPSEHPILSCYYSRVYTLRRYFIDRLSKLPLSNSVQNALVRLSSSTTAHVEFDQWLDSVLIGDSGAPPSYAGDQNENWQQDLSTYTQNLASASILGSSSVPDARLQAEVVSFVLWLLFRKRGDPKHLLAQGYSRASANHNMNLPTGLPGVVCVHMNEHVEVLKGRDWCRMLKCLGRGGDFLMVNLLLDCAIFMPVAEDSEGLMQISGLPLSNVVFDNYQPKNQCTSLPRKFSEIRFVRHRMFYARPALTSHGDVKLGLRHIHVFNRYPNLLDFTHAVHIAAYIFPRQFGLHNVFTSITDSRETTFKFKDYTVREQEIDRWRKDVKRNAKWLPKRLRGHAISLLDDIRKRHRKLPYHELLWRHCPDHPCLIRQVQSSSAMTQASLCPHCGRPFGDSRQSHGCTCNNNSPKAHRKKHRESNMQIEHDMHQSQGKTQHTLAKYSTSPHQVFRFLVAVLRRLFPARTWGCVSNEAALYRNVRRFIVARRSESESLEQVMNGIKISRISWLGLTLQNGNVNMAKSDFQKRTELLAEFMYWIFDSYIIPLIRTNFYVTESNHDKNKLYYFRQDSWKRLTEPTILELRTTMFEEMPRDFLRQMITAPAASKNPLRFSQVRLLPKQSGFRPIMNLRKRPEIVRGGRRVLGRSINSQLASVLKVLDYELNRTPDRLGCSLFSVSGIHTALDRFRMRLSSPPPKMYFAKVDVKSCFDSVPQYDVLDIAVSFMESNAYLVHKVAEVRKPLLARPRVKFTKQGLPSQHVFRMKGEAERRSRIRSGPVVFVGEPANYEERQQALARLLTHHLTDNVVKIGKKFYRQKHGIPQGSVVSSLLCNMFYSQLEMEGEALAFTQQDSTVLMRLIDDFLLVTVDKSVAVKFLQVMHRGLPSYGITVKPEKSMANFEVEINGINVHRPTTHVAGEYFPYCGTLIDMNTLEISKDMGRVSSHSIADSINVELGATPGKTFHRKAINSLRIQMHDYLFDTASSSIATVLTNVYLTLSKEAVRLYHYARTLSSTLPTTLMIQTIDDLLSVAHRIIRSRGEAHGRPLLKQHWVRWMGCRAILDVLEKRQTSFGGLLDWLRKQHSKKAGRRAERRMLKAVAKNAGRMAGKL